MFTLCFTAYDILVSFKFSWDVGLVVALVWPLKSLRSEKLALGQNRLCTTGLFTIVYCIYRWRFGVSTPTKRWHDFSELLHLIRVLKLKLSGYTSLFQPHADAVRFYYVSELPV